MRDLAERDNRIVSRHTSDRSIPRPPVNLAGVAFVESSMSEKGDGIS
jgi:hypothetical protein